MHSLTDTKIRAISPAEEVQRHFDGGGLYLEVSPAGGKWWRLKYRFEVMSQGAQQSERASAPGWPARVKLLVASFMQPMAEYFGNARPR